MKIKRWKAGDNTDDDCGQMALVTKKEATQIIRSLAHQLEKLEAGLDTNDVRVEFYPHDNEYGYFSIGVVRDDKAVLHGEKVGNVNCSSKYGSCIECPETETTPRKELSLGGCYHSGLTYALGYDANGELELGHELFTNLDTGVGDTAMAALIEHRRKFDPTRDIERFIVALKPVEILCDIPQEKYDQPHNNAGCDCCGENDREIGSKLCEDCIEDELINKEVREGSDDFMCDECDGPFKDCDCGFVEDVHCGCLCDDDDTCEDFCLLCDQLLEDCTCDDSDEFCEEFVTDTFYQMDAFTRARWIKSQRKGS